MMLDDLRRFSAEAIERRRLLSWEPIVGAISDGISQGAQAVGIGAETAGTIAQVATPALIGAGGGALASAVGGGNPLYGALGGGALGGIYGAYNAAGGWNGVKGALGMGGGSGAASPVPGATTPVEAGASGTAVGSGGQFAGDDAYAASLAKEGAGDAAKVAAPAAVAQTHGINNTSLALGALAMLGSALSKSNQQSGPYNAASLPGPSSTAATQGPLWNAPFNPSGYLNRTPLTPKLPGQGYDPADPSSYAKSYFNYGPEPQFYANNQLNLGKGFARGGASRGERMFESGGTSHYVDGEDDGQADSRDARLSDGEYVIDASTVSRLGNGNNAAGARKLDAAREAIAHDAGSAHVVQKRIRKSPLQYFGGG